MAPPSKRVRLVVSADRAKPPAASTLEADLKPIDKSKRGLSFSGKASTFIGGESLKVDLIPGPLPLSGKLAKAKTRLKARDNRALKAAQQEQQASEMPGSQKTHRDRSGYVQQNRLGMASMQTFVANDTRDQFNELAQSVGLSSKQLLAYLVDKTISQGIDHTTRAEIATRIELAEKNAEAARRRAVLRVLPNTSKKATP